MNNLTEVQRRLKDATACRESAERNFPFQDYRVVVQNAQLCIELSAKAVIAYFNEPEWTHNPGKQLAGIIAKRRKEISEKWGDLLRNLDQLAVDAEQAAPWHGWVTYGKETDDGPISAIDIVTKDIASDLLERARRSLQTAEKFVRMLKKGTPKQL